MKTVPLKPGVVRCISLWQPWASLMACGAKHMETRSWDTKVRGEIYIHASQTKIPIREWIRTMPNWWICQVEIALEVGVEDWLEKLPFMALVGTGELLSTLPATGVELVNAFPDQAPFGDFTPGRFVHRYYNLQKIEPVALKGRQGFFFAPNPHL